MTKREAAIVSAYTGYLIGDFAEMQVYAESLFKRPCFTGEFGSERFAEELKQKAKPDFVAMKVE